jgi:cell division protein FtsI/penicillin-binding protein 2
MSASSSRLLRLSLAYGACFFVIAAHQLWVMGPRSEEWSVRSYRNRWTFKDVPSVRGSLLDRNGESLAHDEPTFSLDCVYERFRLRHPVGAAVHGATLATKLSGSEVRYSYFGGALGPAAAARLLLSVPVDALLYADLPKEEKRELQSSAITLLCALADRSRSRVRKDLLAAAKVTPHAAVGDCLPELSSEQLLVQFTGVHSRLVALDRALQEAEAKRKGKSATIFDEDVDDPFAFEADAAPQVEAAAPVSRKGLLQRLDGFRVDSLTMRRTRQAADGEPQGELLDRVARPLARELPFHLAAAVRVASDDQPGLFLEPALRRVRAEGLPPTLASLLGAVKPLADQPSEKRAVADMQNYLASRVETVLDDGMLELVPDGLTPIADYQAALETEARATYANVLRNNERRGAGGIERALDDELRGEPGMRLVEHDRKAREQRLWSNLRVEPGADVQLTLDLRLQRLLDDEIDRALGHWRGVAHARGADPAKIDVAMALIDASNGDVLALAGAPHEVDKVPVIPAALRWRGNGALGSIVKPLFLLEQLIATRLGFAHANLGALEPCPQKWRGQDGRTYRCDHAHWNDGTDPVVALAKSCNTFYFQVAEAMGEEGLRRALWRFGMMEAGEGGGDGRYQPRPVQLPANLAAAPMWIADSQGLPMRGVGYSLAANPLSIARADAALATGALPTLSLRYGEARASHSLSATADELALVRRGLRECVESGTAREIEGLVREGVSGKTGTAEIRIGGKDANNAWFAGFVDPLASGTQLAFCAVVYAVPDRVHGADAAGLLVADVLDAMRDDAEISQRYLPAPRAKDGR